MTTVDSELIRKINSVHGQPVPALIVCQDDCRKTIKTLEDAGIQITSTESQALGIIGVKITEKDLPSLQSAGNISAIELDEEAGIY